MPPRETFSVQQRALPRAVSVRRTLQNECCLLPPLPLTLRTILVRSASELLSSLSLLSLNTRPSQIAFGYYSAVHAEISFRLRFFFEMLEWTFLQLRDEFARCLEDVRMWRLVLKCLNIFFSFGSYSWLCEKRTDDFFEDYNFWEFIILRRMIENVILSFCEGDMKLEIEWKAVWCKTIFRVIFSLILQLCRSIFLTLCSSFNNNFSAKKSLISINAKFAKWKFCF